MFRVMNERIVLACTESRTAALTEARSQSLHRNREVAVWFDGALIAVAVRGLLLEFRPMPEEEQVEPTFDRSALERAEERCTSSVRQPLITGSDVA